MVDLGPGLISPKQSGTDRGGPVRIVLCGAGRVGSGLLAMAARRQAALAVGYGEDLRVRAVAEYGGCALDPGGLDLAEVLAALRAGRPLGRLPRVGRPGMTPRQPLDAVDTDVLLEATPVNLAGLPLPLELMLGDHTVEQLAARLDGESRAAAPGGDRLPT